jgi:hypothetical protein
VIKILLIFPLLICDERKVGFLLLQVVVSKADAIHGSALKAPSAEAHASEAAK